MKSRAIGGCIYCGDTGELIDEHVVPFGLKGDFILTRSSCRSCADVTSAVERAVLQGHLVGPRLGIGYPTRHSSDPGAMPPYPPIIGVTAEGQRMPVSFPAGHHPTLLWSPQFEVPASISGKCVSGIVVNGVEVQQISGADITIHAKDQGFASVEFPQIAVRGYEFARMLAKIGLAFAVDCFGIDHLGSPLGATVRHENPDAGMWVGQPTACPPPIARTYEVNGGLHVVKLYAGSEIWAIIRLFAPRNTTMEYLVIVTHR
jgi:hypothetical protein